jgi:hypothetical protein
MKLSIVHNLYKKNPYVNETVRLNLIALNESGVNYQYILFNDHGDESVREDVQEFLSDKVEYIYSDINYGKKLCSGGWIGAQSYVKGDLIHNTGQDDVFTPYFFKQSVQLHENDSELMLVFSNGFKTNEKLELVSLLLPLTDIPYYYSDPLSCFRAWFGVGENGKNEITRANNNIPAPGVIYKKELHNRIGLPDLENFLGAGDFEYWARTLFYNQKCKLIPRPLWLYRCSPLSTSVGNDNKITEWVDKIKSKYYQLYKEKYGS